MHTSRHSVSIRIDRSDYLFETLQTFVAVDFEDDFTLNSVETHRIKSFDSAGVINLIQFSAESSV